jgi:hypothetical protein
MFILGFILFCTVPELMGFIWLHVFHIPRAILGYLILKRLPRSHDILDKVDLPDNHYHLPQLLGLLKESMSRIFIEYTDKCKKILLAYCIFTFIAVFFDFVDLVIQFVRFGRQGDEHSDLAMLFLTIIFLGLDFYYIAWVLQAKQKFPTEISQALVKALLGFANNMTVYLHTNITEARFSRNLRDKFRRSIPEKRTGNNNIEE